MLDGKDGAAASGRGRKRPLLAGQGATEFLMVLGVVLILALIAVMLTSSTTGPSEAKISFSRTYWGAATPLALYEYTMTTDGMLNLSLFNNGGRTLSLETVRVLRNETGGWNNTNTSLQAGKRTSRLITTGTTCREGGIYEWDLNLTYSNEDADLPSQRFVGKEPLIGRCSGLAAGGGGGLCSGLLCDGAACTNSAQCESNHCFDTGGGRVCVECHADGHCAGGEHCVGYVCQ